MGKRKHTTSKIKSFLFSCIGFNCRNVKHKIQELKNKFYRIKRTINTGLKMLNDIELNERRLQVATEKVKELIEKRCKDNGIIKSEIEVEFRKDLIFCLSHTEIKSSNMFNVYGFYCFSFLAMDLYYYDSNVIDKDKKYTIEEVVTRTKNFFNHMAKEINSI